MPLEELKKDPWINLSSHSAVAIFHLLSVIFFAAGDREDFLSTTRILEFSSLATQLVVDIPIVDNLAREETEQFFAHLSLITTGTDTQLSPNEAIIQIIDNDGIMEVKLIGF